MVLTRRTILTTGGVLAFGGMAGCLSVLQASSGDTAHIDVTNKSSTEQTITLAAKSEEKSSNWEDTFSLGAGKTRKAVQEGQTPKDHTVPGNATYHIGIQVADDSPTASRSVVEWQDATGTMIIEVYEDRIKSRIEKDS